MSTTSYRELVNELASNSTKIALLEIRKKEIELELKRRKLTCPLSHENLMFSCTNCGYRVDGY